MMNDPQRRNFLLLNAIGGTAVLGSYLWGAFGAPDTMGSLWGGVPESLRPIYTVNMFLSAFGYFLFAPYIALRLDTTRQDYAGRFGYAWFSTLIALIMIPSALWLPLTSMMLSAPSPALWIAIRIDLLLVGLGSLGLLVTLLTLRAPFPTGRMRAIVGLLPFTLQTAVLDALIWPAFFSV